LSGKLSLGIKVVTNFSKYGTKFEESEGSFVSLRASEIHDQK